MKIKDIIEFILFAFVFVALVVLAGVLESVPIQVGVLLAMVLGGILLFVWLALVIKENREADADVQLKIMIDGEWVAIEDLTPQQTYEHLYRDSSVVQLFDQEVYDDRR